jgi:uncharacterized peroxidase-related enzyme
MAHIKLNNEYPGIRGLLVYRPETAAPMAGLAQALLYSPHPTLSAGERELIATYVSSLNTCKYCTSSHSATAKYQLGGDGEIAKQVIADPETAPISQKLKTLLKIAAKVQNGGKNVLPADIEAARNEGATDIEIHDTVLIAATFCMFNRYVDGLGTWQPDDAEMYDKGGEIRAREGYTTASLKIDINEPVGER